MSIPENVEHFLWIVMHDSLPTNAFRFRRHLTTDASCPWCGLDLISMIRGEFCLLSFVGLFRRLEMMLLSMIRSGVNGIFSARLIPFMTLLPTVLVCLISYILSRRFGGTLHQRTPSNGTWMGVVSEIQVEVAMVV